MAQSEDGGSWTHGTVVGRGDHNHNDRSYTMRVTQKMGHIITRNIKQIKTMSITAEHYLRDQCTKHTENPLDKILKQFKLPFLTSCIKQ